MTTINSGDNYKRILKKIYALYDSGADFVMTRWLFDWDNNLSLVANIENAQKEQLVLNKLKNRKCIDFRIEENGPKRFNSWNDYKIANNLYITPKSDIARVDYDWAVWITDFDYDKFITSCRLFGFDPVNKSTEAMLKMDNFSTPVIIINDIEYRFKTMRYDQNPCKIFNYCLGNKLGKEVTLDDLKMNGISGKLNLKRVFQKTVFSQKDGVLKEFVSIAPKSIKVHNVKNLNKESVSKIKKKSDNNCT